MHARKHERRLRKQDPLARALPQAVCRQGLQAVRYFLMGNRMEDVASATSPAAAAAQGSVGCGQCSARMDELEALREQHVHACRHACVLRAGRVCRLRARACALLVWAGRLLC